jgi:hypothetical protein
LYIYPYCLALRADIPGGIDGAKVDEMISFYQGERSTIGCPCAAIERYFEGRHTLGSVAGAKGITQKLRGITA